MKRFDYKVTRIGADEKINTQQMLNEYGLLGYEFITMRTFNANDDPDFPRMVTEFIFKQEVE
ncbi:MAG: hypothetical protein GQ564_02110 [Bacteroidales bacterium]|nr:hypothetical protein [Bacteroidales bacterium]